MKAFIAGVAVAAALAVTAASFAGSTAKPSASQADVAKLTARVTALEKRVAKLEKDQKLLVDFSLGTAAGAACAATVTADAFQTTWGVIDSIAGTASKFGPQTPLSDQTSCSGIKVARQPPGTMPASLSSFTTVINYLYSP